MGSRKNESAFIFQGLGSDYRKFIYLFHEEQLELLKHYCIVVKDVLQIDLWKYLFVTDMKEDSLSDWIAIYVSGNVIYETYDKKGIHPSILLGYSLGLIIALSCCRAISFIEGLLILKEIFEYKKEHTFKEEAMAVIIGKTYMEMKDILSKQKLSEKVGISIENNESCLTLSGMKEGIEKVINICQDYGVIKASKVKSLYAFHSKFAEVGIESLIQLVNRIDIADIVIPVMSVYNQKLLYNSQDLRKEIIINMSHAMLWKQTILAVKKFGITNFLEISLDGSLTKISRIIDLDFKFKTFRQFQKL